MKAKEGPCCTVGIHEKNGIINWTPEAALLACNFLNALRFAGGKWNVPLPESAHPDFDKPRYWVCFIPRFHVIAVVNEPAALFANALAVETNGVLCGSGVLHMPIFICAQLAHAQRELTFLKNTLSERDSLGVWTDGLKGIQWK